MSDTSHIIFASKKFQKTKVRQSYWPVELVLVRRGRVCIMSLVSEGVFSLRGGECSEEGDPEYECVGTGKVAVLLEWTGASLKR